MYLFSGLNNRVTAGRFLFPVDSVTSEKNRNCHLSLNILKTDQNCSNVKTEKTVFGNLIYPVLITVSNQQSREPLQSSINTSFFTPKPFVTPDGFQFKLSSYISGLSCTSYRWFIIRALKSILNDLIKVNTFFFWPKRPAYNPPKRLLCYIEMSLYRIDTL